MKKIAAIFLSFLFLIYLGGIQVMYWVKIDGAKKDASAFLNNNKFKKNSDTKLLFTTAQYNSLGWSDNNKEFTYNCQLYDVSEIKYVAGGVEVQCYADNAETEVVNAFHNFIDHLLSSQSRSGSSDNDMISKIIKEYVSIKITPIPDSFCFNIIPFASKAKLYTFSLPASIWHPPASC